MDVKQNGIVFDLLKVAVGLSLTDKRLASITRAINDAYGYMPDSDSYLKPEAVRGFAESLQRTEPATAPV
jgi:hypothetical protein